MNRLNTYAPNVCWVPKYDQLKLLTQFQSYSEHQYGTRAVHHLSSLRTLLYSNFESLVISLSMLGGERQSGGLGTLVIIGAALFLRPRDLYTFSRVAGRICGTGVYSLRGLRKTMSEAVAAEAPSQEMAGMRDSMVSSFRKLESITRTVSREVADSSPVAGLRAATTFTPKRRSPASISDSSSSSAQTESMLTPPKLVSVSTPNGRGESGAQIISRVIEEGAFAQQQAKIFGSASFDNIDDDKKDKK